VSASRELLLVGVLGNMQSVSCEAGSVPDQTVLLGHQSRNFPRDDLVRHRVLGVRVEFVGVRYVPSPDRLVVADTGPHSLQRRFLGHESVAVSVLFASHRGVAGNGVYLENCVLVTIDRWVKAQTEQMLVVVCVDTGVDLSSVRCGRLARGQCVGRQDAGQLDFKLDYTVLVHNPVDHVFVVAGSEDLADDQLASSCGSGRLVAW
jgi:hypothetical protein